MPVRMSAPSVLTAFTQVRNAAVPAAWSPVAVRLPGRLASPVSTSTSSFTGASGCERGRQRPVAPVRRGRPVRHVDAAGHVEDGEAARGAAPGAAPGQPRAACCSSNGSAISAPSAAQQRPPGQVGASCSWLRASAASPRRCVNALAADDGEDAVARVGRRAPRPPAVMSSHRAASVVRPRRGRARR